MPAGVPSPDLSLFSAFFGGIPPPNSRLPFVPSPEPPAGGGAWAMDASDTLVLCGLEKIEEAQTFHGRPVCQDPKGSPCRSAAEARSWRGVPAEGR
jgi:hypothetical protein